MDNRLIYDFDKLTEDARELAGAIGKGKYKSLIIISRGGLFLGGLLAYHLDIPCVDVLALQSYNTENQRQAIRVLKTASYALDDVLIVDDVADSGETLKFAQERYRGDTVTIFKKPSSKHTPTYYLHETDQWIVFPWEV